MPRAATNRSTHVPPSRPPRAKPRPAAAPHGSAPESEQLRELVGKPVRRVEYLDGAKPEASSILTVAEVAPIVSARADQPSDGGEVDAAFLDPVHAAWERCQAFKRAEREYWRAYHAWNRLHPGSGKCGYPCSPRTPGCDAAQALRDAQGVLAPRCFEVASWARKFGVSGVALEALLRPVVAGTMHDVWEALQPAHREIDALVRELRARLPGGTTGDAKATAAEAVRPEAEPEGLVLSWPEVFKTLRIPLGFATSRAPTEESIRRAVTKGKRGCLPSLKPHVRKGGVLARPVHELVKWLESQLA